MRICYLLLLAALLTGCLSSPEKPENSVGNVIFIHPDGYSLQAWQAFRALEVGPDGNTAWDLLPALSLYRAHVRNSLAPTSHAGGTIHGYGIKVGRDSFGLDEGQPIVSASGFDGSLMMEAVSQGIRCGIINSGHLAEPGTAAMLARVKKRSNKTGIVAQFLNSGADIILGGGEIYFLPKGQVGKHGRPGVREDKRNLVTEFEQAGYQIVYQLEELAALPDQTDKVLGLFAADNTYNSESEETLEKKKLSPYNPGQPTVAEMTREALRLLSAQEGRFFLMVEEEGTDNFGNANNASGLFEAYRRADACIAVGRAFLETHPETLLLTAADSDASGMQLLVVDSLHGRHQLREGKLPPTSDTGAAIDGIQGSGSAPFTSAPDRQGQRFQFGVLWPTGADLPGAVVARADGLNAERLKANIDNTEIYDLIYLTLFGKSPTD
jgi:alkaline phosphatase